MSKTPETDAAVKACKQDAEVDLVPATLADKLERRLAEVSQLAEGRLTQWKKEEVNHALDLKQLYAVTQERDKLKDKLAVAKEFRAKAEEIEQQSRGEVNKLRGQIAEANRLWRESCDNNEFLRREADALRAQVAVLFCFVKSIAAEPIMHSDYGAGDCIRAEFVAAAKDMLAKHGKPTEADVTLAVLASLVPLDAPPRSRAQK